MDFVSGGGVPVGAWHNQGMAQVANSDTAGSVPTPAAWAVLDPHRDATPVVTICTATTRAGADCQMAPVQGTELCVSHWAAVQKMVNKGLVPAGE